MDYNAQWKEELRLIGSILDKAPLEKAFKWGSDVYTLNGKNIVSYGGFKNYFAIWFYNGVFMNDKYRMLINAQEGKTKALRQWRFTSADKVDEGRILEYVKDAIEVERKGLKIKSDMSYPMEKPFLLEEAIHKDPVFGDAFENFSPGKKKEFILYIKAAKQDGTKLLRMDKIKRLVALGIGLNDQYK